LDFGSWSLVVGRWSLANSPRSLDFDLLTFVPKYPLQN
jgi:hypothetical protein